MKTQEIKNLALLYAETEPDRLEDHKEFWIKWFSDEIEGDKYTAIKRINHDIVGVARAWKTPHLNIGYLVEGLYVYEAYRQKGIAKELLGDLITFLSNKGEKYIYSTIKHTNIACIKAHIAVGFTFAQENTWNSFNCKVQGLNLYRKSLISEDSFEEV